MPVPRDFYENSIMFCKTRVTIKDSGSIYLVELRVFIPGRLELRAWGCRVMS